MCRSSHYATEKQRSHEYGRDTSRPTLLWRILFQKKEIFSISKKNAQRNDKRYIHTKHIYESQRTSCQETRNFRPMRREINLESFIPQEISKGPRQQVDASLKSQGLDFYIMESR